jgi:uncharacterized protein (TIGR02145 family)
MTKTFSLIIIGLTSLLSISSYNNYSERKKTNKQTKPSKNKTIQKEVKIGNQTWMNENLNVEFFRNGQPINEAKTQEDWKIAGENQRPAWCYYNNEELNGTSHGKLYNWYAVNDPRGLAPEGWKIPTNDDYINLQYSTRNLNDLLLVKNPNGFRMVYSGDRNSEGEFYGFKKRCHLWTSNMNNEFNSKYHVFGEGDGYSALHDDNRGAGFSVRLIKDKNYIETETIRGITYMKNNLKKSTFKNGDKIIKAKSKKEWLEACRKNQPAYCYYNFDPRKEEIGYLYNYFAFIDRRGLAPNGFRMMTENDILMDNITIKTHGGTLAGETGIHFGLKEFTLFWSACTESSTAFSKTCFYQTLPESTPVMFDRFPEFQGMYIRCIKK